MFYLILKKNMKKKSSYNILLYNSKKQVKKKIGSLGYNSGVRMFVLTVDFFVMCELMKVGFYFGYDFYKELNKVVNNIKL